MSWYRSVDLDDILIIKGEGCALLGRGQYLFGYVDVGIASSDIILARIREVGSS